MTKKVEGQIERIGYDPGSTSLATGFLYIVLVGDNNVYHYGSQGSHVYSNGIESTFGPEMYRSLLLLTKEGDQITFEQDYNEDPFILIKSRSLRNWTLEKRLGYPVSEKDITPSDPGLTHSQTRELPGDNS